MKRICRVIIILIIPSILFYACSSARIGGAKLEAVKDEIADIKMDSMEKSKKSISGKKGSSKEVKTWKRSQVLPNTSRLMIGDKEELPCKGMQVKVKISGFRARVLIDYYFYNDRDRQYEGNFKLRLPTDASPYFLAFGETIYKEKSLAQARPYFLNSKKTRSMGMNPKEIMDSREKSWHKVKEARMVPKEKAAFAYKTTVRRRVDPALMEWSGSGIFSARVFPLVPKKMHRIVIGYDMDLIEAGKDFLFRLDLPKKVPDKVIDIEVNNPVKKGSSVVVKPAVRAGRTNRGRYYHYVNPRAATISVRLKKTGSVLLIGTDAGTDTYFATKIKPKLPRKTAGRKTGSAVFLVDCSLSSNPDKFNVWLSLLESILEKNQKSLKQFSVLFFNIETFRWKKNFVKNNKKNRKALLAFANSLSLEGATDIGAALRDGLNTARLNKKKNKQCDIFLLSDGSVTWGEGNGHALLKIISKQLKGSLFAYRTGMSGSDTGLLGKLARGTGGSVFSVVGEAEVAKAAVAHRLAPWDLVSVSIDKGRDLLLAGNPSTIFPGQSLLLVGRGKPAIGTVKLRVKNKLGKKKTLLIKQSQFIRTELAPRLFGQIAVSQLEDFASASEKFSKAYATHFRITGKTCSLLMLESENEYRRFNIKPHEDSFVVKQNNASSIISKILKEIGDSLGNPKAAFRAWLKKIEKTPGTRLKIPDSLNMVIAKMPVPAFLVKPKPLRCALHSRKGIPEALLKQLQTKKLIYDDLSKEAKRRLKKYGPADALKAVSSLAENSPGDAVLIRDIAFSAMEWGLEGHAYHLFRRAVESRPFEPQTYHALASVLRDIGSSDLALIYYEIALAGNWDSRFGDFRQIVLLDYISFLRKVRSGVYKSGIRDYALARLKTLSKEFSIEKVDLLITIMWNTDSTDVDLHVIDPNKEECYYSHRVTKIGGKITRDVTTGYGPEMFTLEKAISGKYTVKAKYFSSNQNRASTRTKIYATVYKNWGKQDEAVRKKVVTLAYGKEMHEIAVVDFD
ncbi:MAG: VWA domain-containing protein [bacterium]|nr:VWA domain-containing protein [bacterium]